MSSNDGEHFKNSETGQHSVLRRSEKAAWKKWDLSSSLKYGQKSDIGRRGPVEGFSILGRILTETHHHHHVLSTVPGLHKVWVQGCANSTREVMKTSVQ